MPSKLTCANLKARCLLRTSTPRLPPLRRPRPSPMDSAGQLRPLREGLLRRKTQGRPLRGARMRVEWRVASLPEKK
uniref:Uncharacterized protein n=1 Tax=Steinernema glaseri TaxID=37863 RepID=A0A1I7Z4F4_9BILA